MRQETGGLTNTDRHFLNVGRHNPRDTRDFSYEIGAPKTISMHLVGRGT